MFSQNEKNHLKNSPLFFFSFFPPACLLAFCQFGWLSKTNFKFTSIILIINAMFFSFSTYELLVNRKGCLSFLQFLWIVIWWSSTQCHCLLSCKGTWQVGLCLTLKTPRKTCIWKCRLFMSSAGYSCKLFKPIFAYRQTGWTHIRLLLKEQSDLGPRCLQKWHSQADDKADDNCCDWQFKG